MKKQFDNALFKDLNKTAADSFGSNIKMIDVNDIEPNSENFYSMTDIELLAEDIERQGIKHNLVVSPQESGKYIIISGHRRFAAFCLLWKEKRITSHYLPCYINPKKSDDETFQDLIMLNATTRVLSDSEILKQYECLKHIYDIKKSNGIKTGCIRERIAEILGVSNGQVAKLENINKNASPELKQAIENDEVSLSTANEIAKLDEEEQRKLLDNNDTNDIKHKDVKKHTKNNDSRNNKKDVTNDNFFNDDLKEADSTEIIIKKSEAIVIAKYLNLILPEIIENEEEIVESFLLKLERI